MSQVIKEVFENKKDGPVFLAFVTAGFPSVEETVPILLGLQRGGADIIELGVPHSGMYTLCRTCFRW
jgi:tryptophan synthase